MSRGEVDWYELARQVGSITGNESGVHKEVSGTTYARRALELNDQEPVSHMALGNVLPDHCVRLYELTRAGRTQLKKELAQWERLSSAMTLAIKLDSRGPVIYRQRRVGKDGRAAASLSRLSSAPPCGRGMPRNHPGWQPRAYRSLHDQPRR